jgi:pimeloyl-ACP methyl ester carboxylesterase
LAYAASCFGADGTGLHKQVVFDHYPALTTNAELIDRLFRPMLARRLREELASTGHKTDEQGIDLARERFALYVPANAPPSGKYGLLVWISPFDEAAFPSSWLPVLDKHGIICVTAGGSGNAANVYSRRIPLALLGYANVTQAYPVDPARTYVGGLSGGSRVALRVALAFPDLFRGAVLNAGSDPFGSAALPPPKPELFRQFEEGTRLVYATGSRDTEHLTMDAHSRDSARNMCITDLQTEEMRGRGHEWIDAATLDRALTALSTPRKPDAELAACRERRQQQIDAQLREIETLVGGGDKREAEKRLQTLDERYGGLAAPRSVELERGL